MSSAAASSQADARGRDHVGRHSQRNLLLGEVPGTARAHEGIGPVNPVLPGAEDGDAVGASRGVGVLRCSFISEYGNQRIINSS